MTEHAPWIASYPSWVRPTLEPYPEISLFGMLEASARQFPDRPAIAFMGRHLHYRAVLDQVERCSAVLARLGVRRGDRVALISPNTPHYVIAYYAAARLGAIAVGNNPLYTQPEMEHQLRDSDPSVVVVFDRFYPAFASLFDSLGIRAVVATSVVDYLPFPRNLLAPLVLRRRARAEGEPFPPVPRDAPVRRWRDLMRSPGPVPPVAIVDPAADAAVFTYTGGTTGPSKGAMLSHRNLVANAMQASEFLGMKPGEEVILCALPFFHAFGMLAMNVGLNVGGKIVVIPNPRDLEHVLKETHKEKPTFFPGVPRMYVSLNESPLTPKYDLRSIRACISGAAPLPQTVAERFAEITGGARLVEGYGMSEASPVTHANPVDGRGRFGTIGVPMPDTGCRIVDLTNPEREVDLGERGELCVRGPQVMLGYWNRPEETALAVRNGWLHTGDIAVMERDGFFRIVDRLKEMIIVSGFNVYPTEIEEALLRHPKIRQVCVIGVPNDRTGEAVKAFIVLERDERATPQEIVAWAEDPANGLSGYRVPKQVEFRDSLPETQLGKVLRRVLQEEERAKRAAASLSAAPGN